MAELDLDVFTGNGMTSHLTCLGNVFSLNVSEVKVCLMKVGFELGELLSFLGLFFLDDIA